MPAVTIRAGMQLDIPDKREIAEVTRQQFHDWSEHERERARGLKPDGRVMETFNLTDAASTVFIDAVVPNQGVTRDVKLISVQLTASDTAQAFIGTSTSDVKRLISNFGAAATSQVATFSSSAVYLKPGEGIVLKTAAHAPTIVFITYAEVIAELAYKSYD